MNYIELNISFSEKNPWADIVTSDLADIGFDSFVDTENGIQAYIQEDHFAKEKTEKFLKSVNTNISYTFNLIEDQNWNAEWEKNYPPIIVRNKCIVKAPFHVIEEAFDYEVTISPKMSFGTGHHNTTFLMIKSMLDIDFKDLSVLDMGSGTGVLAFLAELKGSKNVIAIDNENWAYENMLENIKLNKSKKVNAFLGDATSLSNIDTIYDVILANINRNILIQDMPVYSNYLKKGGTIIFSGFYDSDLDLIKENCAKNDLTFVSFQEKDHWVNATFLKS